MNANDYLKMHENQETREQWYELVAEAFLSEYDFDGGQMLISGVGSVDAFTPCPASLAELVKEQVRGWGCDDRNYFGWMLDEMIDPENKHNDCAQVETVADGALATPAQIVSAALAAAEGMKP